VTVERRLLNRNELRVSESCTIVDLIINPRTRSNLSDSGEAVVEQKRTESVGELYNSRFVNPRTRSNLSDSGEVVVEQKRTESVGEVYNSRFDHQSTH
jgi:hypothetical protein